MNKEEKESFDILLEADALDREKKGQETSKKLKQEDEYEQLSLYGGKD